MKKIYGSVLLITILTGCVKPDLVDKAQQDYVCKESGGVHKYVRYGGGLSNPVRCMNGSYKKWYNVVIPLEEL